MTLDPKLLRELQDRRAAIAAGGGKDKLDKRRERGQLSARERLGALFEPDTFQEIGGHVRHQARLFGMQDKELPADGVVVGTGYVDGVPVAAVSQDFSVAGGTLGKMHARKMLDVMSLALRSGMPLVAFKDSAGARIQEGVEALAGYGQVFYQNVLMSGVVPQIAVVMGPCAGGAAYCPALMDFVIMTRRNAHMFITGPEIIAAVTGRETRMDEIGSAEIHAAVSGNAHFVAEDEADAIALVRRLLGYLPANNSEDPPHRLESDIALDRDEGVDALVPDESSEAMDVRSVIGRLVDGGELLEVHARFARNLIVGFARIEGVVVGIVANQPQVLAGALDIDASDKGARFVRFCNVFNIPLVTLVDVPGFLPGVEQERGGIIRHGAKMLYAYAASTVPKITVILRKAYGGSYLAMCSREMGADLVLAWPTAEIAVMGAEGAVRLLHRRDLAAAEHPETLARHLAAEYRERFCSPYLSASLGYVSDVIEPAETRAVLALALRKLLTKREGRPLKKHGTIPL